MDKNRFFKEIHTMTDLFYKESSNQLKITSSNKTPLSTQCIQVYKRVY